MMFAERDSDYLWAIAMIMAAGAATPLITLTTAEKAEISFIMGRTFS